MAEAVLDQRRHRRQRDHRLCDPAARVGGDPAAQRVQLRLGGLRSDHDALATGPVDRLDHQFLQPVQHLLAGRVLLQPPGVDVAMIGSSCR